MSTDTPAKFVVECDGLGITSRVKDPAGNPIPNVLAIDIRIRPEGLIGATFTFLELDVAGRFVFEPDDSSPIGSNHPKTYKVETVLDPVDGTRFMLGAFAAHTFVPDVASAGRPIPARVDDFIEREGRYWPHERGIHGKLGRALTGWRAAEEELKNLTLLHNARTASLDHGDVKCLDVLVPIPDHVWPGVYEFDPAHPEYGIDDEGRKCLRLDACIVPAIQALWAAGIVTRSCCCGHGNGWGVVTITTTCAARWDQPATVEEVHDLLLLLEERDTRSTKQIAEWSEEERAEVAQWAATEIAAANDNPVKRLPRPAVMGDAR